MHQINAVLAIAQRDFMKLLRDPARLVSSLIFPLIFITVLGGSLQASFGSADFNLLTYTFTGVLAQTLFQSSATGVISLISDREEDFSQEMFITPISRYSIIFGKTAGETMVALPQGFVLVMLAFALGVGMTFPRALALLPFAIVACLLGASFGRFVQPAQPALRQPGVPVFDSAAVFSGRGIQSHLRPAAVSGFPVRDGPHALRGGPAALGLLRG